MAEQTTMPPKRSLTSWCWILTDSLSRRVTTRIQRYSSLSWNLSVPVIPTRVTARDRSSFQRLYAGRKMSLLTVWQTPIRVRTIPTLHLRVVAALWVRTKINRFLMEPQATHSNCSAPMSTRCSHWSAIPSISAHLSTHAATTIRTLSMWHASPTRLELRLHRARRMFWNWNCWQREPWRSMPVRQTAMLPIARSWWHRVIVKSSTWHCPQMATRPWRRVWIHQPSPAPTTTIWPIRPSQVAGARVPAHRPTWMSIPYFTRVWMPVSWHSNIL